MRYAGLGQFTNYEYEDGFIVLHGELDNGDKIVQRVVRDAETIDTLFKTCKVHSFDAMLYNKFIFAVRNNDYLYLDPTIRNVFKAWRWLLKGIMTRKS